jgi:hypothetical protein
MVKYRYEYGSSSKVEENAPKHIDRLGKIHEIIGYRWYSKRTSNGVTYSNFHERVKFVGENGFCIFDGVCWGYFGQGPRTLKGLLIHAGINDNHLTDSVCFFSPRNNKVGVDWTISINDNKYCLTCSYEQKAA